ncbi:hypothetical protein [Rubrolithibacter danxiaensis]|uniref:hypothetical protein n=1 Tax=Rubrolithibacter danxiaensis TaxID=3390805 RepID=UPI003BF9243A
MDKDSVLFQTGGLLSFIGVDLFTPEIHKSIWLTNPTQQMRVGKLLSLIGELIQERAKGNLKVENFENRVLELKELWVSDDLYQFLLNFINGSYKSETLIDFSTRILGLTATDTISNAINTSIAFNEGTI